MLELQQWLMQLQILSWRLRILLEQGFAMLLTALPLLNVMFRESLGKPK